MRLMDTVNKTYPDQSWWRPAPNFCPEVTETSAIEIMRPIFPATAIGIEARNNAHFFTSVFWVEYAYTAVRAVMASSERSPEHAASTFKSK